MKKLILLSLLLVSCMVCGCRSKKVLVTEAVDVTNIDTTKIQTDTASVEATFTDTSKETTVSEMDLEVEFVDSGGSVCLDPQGNLILNGVKNLKGKGAKATAVNTNIEATAKSTASHNDINKGETNKAKKNTVTEEKPKEKWHDAIVEKIGQLCCIAALLYAIFLYIKRKK